MAVLYKIKIKDQNDICNQDKTPTLVHKNNVTAQHSLHYLSRFLNYAEEQQNGSK